MRIVWLVVSLVACGGGGGGGEEGDDSGTAGAEGVTWREVSPILEAHCASCHQPGSIGPFSLLTYDEAKAWAPMIAAETAARAMPPYLVKDDGTCEDFRDGHWLSDEDLATLAAWADGGAPAGSDVAELTPPHPPTLDEPYVVTALPEITPEAEGDLFAPNDEYRCFRVDNLTDHDVFLTGYEVIPGNDLIVHHVLGMPVDPLAPSWDDAVTNEQELQRLEAEDDRPGWDCLGTVGGAARELSIPVDWAPGQGAVEYPDGLGIRVRPSDTMVFQVHYNLADPANVGQSDQTSVHLKLEDAVQAEAYVGLPDALLYSIYDFPDADVIPYGEEAYEYTWEMTGEDLLWIAYHPTPMAVEEFQLRGVLPHMHQRGVSQKLEIVRDGGGKDCGFDLPVWDFEWQRVYWYEEPITIDKDDKVKVTCTYDTSNDLTSIWPGWGTNNEMCLVGMVLTTVAE